VLAKANRVTSGADYREIVRRGRRAGGANTVCYIRRSTAETPARFGFIVSKKVGTAVRRNLVRRRMKAAAHEFVDRLPAGSDIVVRALPGADQASWDTLHAEISAAIDRIFRTA
jgi:ribonuclease P protein component